MINTYFVPYYFRKMGQELLPQRHPYSSAYLITLAAMGAIGTLIFLQIGPFSALNSWSDVLGYAAFGTCGVGFGLWLLHKYFRLKNHPVTHYDNEAYSLRSVRKKLYRQSKAAANNSNTAKRLATIPFDTSAPARLPDVKEEENDDPTVGIKQTAGREKQIQDVCYSEQLDQNKVWNFYAIFDGNKEIGEYLQSALPDALRSKLLELDESNAINDATITDILSSAFVRLNKNIMEDETIRGVATATCVLIIDFKIYIVNLGDSRTIAITSNDRVRQMSKDADLSNPQFRRAIKKEGYAISKNRHGVRRVNGLTIARGFGREELSPRPKITCMPRSDAKYLILGTRRLYDVASNLEIAEKILTMEEQEASPSQMAASLVESAARADDHHNNIAAMVIAI